jgi:hypothetical protein
METELVNKASVASGTVLLPPPALEYQLLRRHRTHPTSTTSEVKVAGDAEIAEGVGVGYCSKWGNAVAACDLQGQTAAEPDWYRNIEFVCMHCLQPARGLAFGNPVSAEKAADDGKTTWVVRGRFGSVGCALRYASDNRYTFSQETSGMLPLMLIRAYGFTGDVVEIPIAPARTELPPFQPTLCKKWAAGEIHFDGYSFHDKLNQGMSLQPPDPTKHLIVSDHCALLVDAQIAREKLDFSAKQLKHALPNLHTKPRIPPNPSSIIPPTKS